MMTAHQIYNMYGIYRLVQDINIIIFSLKSMNIIKDCAIVYVNDWNKVRIIPQQKSNCKGGKLIF